MLKNHFTSALRNLKKHKGFTFIHVGGLAIGLAAAILVLHYARLEHAYDEFHINANQTYRITTERLREGVPTSHFASTFAGVSPAILAEYPEVAASCRLFKRYRGGVVSFEDEHFRESNVFHADSGFFKVFSFPLLSGVENDLFNPGSAFVEEQTALKYFGSEDPIGKRIKFGSFDGVEEYEIRGVIRCPETSSIKFTFLFSYHDLGRIFGTEHQSNWSWLDFHTFAVLTGGESASNFETKLRALTERNLGPRSATIALRLQPLTDIYLKSNTEFETGKTGNETVVNVLLALGIIILAIVSLNFINLSTSHSLTRAREVGIRKALGSSRQNLISQFILETFITSSIALALCIVLIALALPHFNQLTQREISLTSFLVSDLWLYMTVFLIFGSFIIGLYPALVLSAFRAVDVLKGFFIPKGKGTLLREMFVGFQAFVSFSLVVAILVIIDQLRFVNQKDLGIDISQTLVISTPDVNSEGYLNSLDSYKSTIRQLPGVVDVTTTVDSPGSPISWLGGSRKVGADVNDQHTFFRAVIDEDFLNTMNAQLLAGKMFSPKQYDRDILINKKVASDLDFTNLDESIGQRILVGRDTFNIIGVVDDFHQVSPREAVPPTIFHYNLEPPRLFMIKYEKGHESDLVRSAGAAYAKMYPNAPFDYYFLDDFFDQQYDMERRLTTIVTAFCILAIIVSSLGLLGLTWFRLARQKKELAIRKIIGSSDLNLFANASRRLVLTTIIGSFVAIPVIWMLMNRWLESFAYHTTPKLWEFAVAVVVSLLILLVSISGHTIKVIRTNPVNHLRQE
ncbi:MAG TPA: ABC transporter permease [Cyclobacteriaceae bacterium]|nr:ABC transporter permease [Cyclobacteriaceae bacterium]